MESSVSAGIIIKRLLLHIIQVGVLGMHGSLNAGDRGLRDLWCVPHEAIII